MSRPIATSYSHCPICGQPLVGGQFYCGHTGQGQNAIEPKDITEQFKQDLAEALSLPHRLITVGLGMSKYIAVVDYGR